MRVTGGGVSLAKDARDSDTIGSARHFGIHLRCPRCKADMTQFDCLRCDFQFRDIRGVLHALPPERVVYYARFIDEYERIRDAEGRGSDSDDFYLGLPYRDSSGRNSQQWCVRARSFDFLIQRLLKPAIPSGGRILDLGAGNCWMSYRLALAGFTPCAVDILTNDQDGLGAAEHYRKYLPEFFARFRAELNRLPFQDETFDAVIFNASFHYAEDYTAVLQEALRCIKRNGLAIISDTPWYTTEANGQRMVSERRASFLARYGTTSASIQSLEFLTNDRLRLLENQLSIHWTIYSPGYGLKWAMRPIVARLRKKREPSRFRIYVARKASA